MAASCLPLQFAMLVPLAFLQQFRCNHFPPMMLRPFWRHLLFLGTWIALWQTMRVAIPIWQGRISPVFDVAGQLLLVELADGREIAREDRVVDETAADERARKLVELGVKTLICAGISQSLEASLADHGIRVIPRICGDVEEVLAAFLTRRLGAERFAMPGCCGQGRRRHRGGCGRRGRSNG